MGGQWNYTVYSGNDNNWLLSLGFKDCIFNASNVKSSFFDLAFPIILKWLSCMGCLASW